MIVKKSKASLVKTYDVIVIGSAAGTKIAFPASDRGLRVALVEKGPLGGTCLNRGCIPSKMFISPADLMHAIRNAPLLNIELSGEVRVRFPDMVERIAQSVQGLSASLRKQVETRPNLDLYWGTARFVADKTICVNQDRLSADRIFIASGSRPSLLPIDGLDKTPYMTSTEALLNRQLPSTMIVLGAGYVACELGHAYESFGTKTSFIVRSELLRGMDRDVKSEFRRVFSRRHRLYEQVVPLRALYEGGVFKILVEAPATGKRTELESEALLVAAGRVPDTQDLGLENTSIETTDGGFIRVNDRLQTRVEGVYALGDCVGRYFSRHSANFEGEYLLRTLFEAPSDEPIRYGPMPYAIFAVPEAAGLGKTEDALEREGVDCVAGFSTYADSNMGMARRLDYGFAKILVAPRNKALLGAHIVGPEASDMIHMLIALMYKGGDLDDLLKMVYIHPALPEVVRDAARDAKAKLK